MKHLTLFALALLALPTLAQPGASRPTTAHAPRLAPEAPAAAAGNPNYRLVQLTKQQFRSNGGGPAAWLDTLRYTYSRFTPANLPRRTVRENAPTRGAALRNLRQDNMLYNAAGSVTSDSTIVYNTTTGQLNGYPTLIETYTYDAQNHLLSDLLTVRLGGTYTPYGRTSYTYNAAGQNTLILDEFYSGGAWTADSRDLLTYDPAGHLSSDEFQIADLAGTTFSPSFKDLFTSDAAGNVLTDQQQSYNNGAYTNIFLVSYAYAGPLGQRNSYRVQRNAGTTLQNYGQGTDTFDTAGNLTQETQQLWNTTTQAYADDVRFLYTYQQVLATAAAAFAGSPLLAPNPVAAGTTATLRYELPAAAPIAVQVFDALGRLAFTRPAAAQAAGAHTLEMPALVPGLYVVRLAAGTQSQTTRLVVE